MISWPFDSTVTQDTEGNPIYDRGYSSDAIAAVLATYFKNGIFSTTASSFQVRENEGMTVTVSPGAGNINGRQCREESDRVLAVQAASASLDRIDTVVLRLDVTIGGRTIDLYVVQGTPAATPAAPALTRNASVYELGIANLFIAKNTTSIPQHRITDTRLDDDRCGVVASIVGDTNTSTYYAQIQADLAAFKANEESGFSSWSLAQQAAFESWFDGVQNTLGEDTAGNLLNLINHHAAKEYAATLTAAGWTGSAPYTQTVAVAGMLDTDTPLVDVVLSDTAATAQEQLEAYGLVGRIDTGEGTITATCYEDKPEVNLTLAFKVVR